MKYGTIKRACCIRSYHVYKEILGSSYWQNLCTCVWKKPRNIVNKYAMVVNNDRLIIGHFLKRSCMFAHFSYRGEEAFSVQWLVIVIDVIICWEICFMFLNFVVHTNHENIFTTKISRHMVHVGVNKKHESQCWAICRATCTQWNQPFEATVLTELFEMMLIAKSCLVNDTNHVKVPASPDVSTTQVPSLGS